MSDLVKRKFHQEEQVQMFLVSMKLNDRIQQAAVL
jgi:hypothetical protein